MPLLIAERCGCQVAKIKKIALLLSCFIFFVGCNSAVRDINADKTGVAEFYKAVAGLKFQVGITADFPERISKYRVCYTYARDERSIVEILEPEEINGVKISVDSGETKIEFDGARLETGKLNENGLTPLSALPKLVEQWISGDITEVEAVRRDGVDATLMIYSADDENIEYRTWFDRTSYNPIYAEIIVDGKCVIRCEYETVSQI